MPTNSPNMQLTIPTVGATAGPLYASDVNDALNLIDQHDHSTGRGVAITPDGLNISVDLTFRGNSATHLLSAQFDENAVNGISQSLYIAPGGESPTRYDLFYNDSAGNSIQITKDGLVNSTIGSLPGQSYAAGTFIWKQGAGSTTPADFDIGSITIRPNTAATTNGVTLAPPSSIASAYTLLLPVDPTGGLPSGALGTAFMTLDTAGQIAAPVSTSAGITPAMLAPGIATGTTTLTAGGTYNITAIYTSVFFDASGGAITANLMSPVGVGGRTFKLKKTDSTLSVVTIGTLAGTIDGASSITLNTVGEEYEVVSDGSNWQITNHKTRTAPVAFPLTIQGFAAVASSNMLSWRDGQWLYIQGSFSVSGGATANGRMSIGFNGANQNISINTSLLGASNLTAGRYAAYNVSANNHQGQIVYLGNVTQQVAFGPVTNTTNVNALSETDMNTIIGAGGGEYITVDFRLPISGWLP